MMQADEFVINPMGPPLIKNVLFCILYYRLIIESRSADEVKQDADARNEGDPPPVTGVRVASPGKIGIEYVDDFVYMIARPHL